MIRLITNGVIGVSILTLGGFGCWDNKSQVKAPNAESLAAEKVKLEYSIEYLDKFLVEGVSFEDICEKYGDPIVVLELPNKHRFYTFRFSFEDCHMARPGPVVGFSTTFDSAMKLKIWRPSLRFYTTGTHGEQGVSVEAIESLFSETSLDAPHGAEEIRPNRVIVSTENSGRYRARYVGEKANEEPTTRGRVTD